MCGLAGSWNLSKEVVTEMATHQISRGPDRLGLEQYEKVIFSQNRLAIIDKSEAGNQPMTNPQGILSYVGEIYNYSTQFSTDTAWVLDKLMSVNDYSQIFNSFNGMWALAYYDKVKEEIILCKDRFGIKPLYYTHQKDFFAFASTPAAVALTKPDWGVSVKGLQEYLSLGATMLHSMFSGIEAVPPGHYVTFNCKTNEVKVKRWYYPKFIENALEVIEEKVVQAIDRVKLTCDWPQIILLSGGIDSSLVASRYTGQNAIHLASPEQEYAQTVADRFGIKLNNVHPHDFSVEECLMDYTSKCGDPTMAGFIPYITCQEIKKLGFRVAITANGADELFWGYERMKDINEQKQAIFRQFSFTESILMQYCVPRNAQKVEIDTYLTYDLNKTLDFASMCHSIEVRVPYLDHELVEAALSISQEKHCGNLGNKHILKKMLVDLGFDFGFIHRPKMGFSLYHEPSDLASMKNMAMDWYNQTDYPKLSLNGTGRQESYHSMTILGLYIWSKIYGKL